jgi:hypothetical protein
MAGGTADARRIWGHTIWRLRKLRRWSQDRLALELQRTSVRIGYGLPPNREHITRAIQCWEAAERAPSDDYCVVLVAAFALEEELGDGSLTPGSELDQLMTALGEMGYDVDRRRFLLSAAALALVGRDSFATWNTDGAERLGYVLRHPRSVDAATVAHLREQLRGLDTRYDQTPSTSLLPTAGQLLGQVTFLRQHAPAGRVCQELSAVEAQSATLMGQLVWDASQRRDHTTANGYYDQAAAAARDAGDAATEACAVLRSSFVALYGEHAPEQGLVLAQQAATLAGGWGKRHPGRVGVAARR